LPTSPFSPYFADKFSFAIAGRPALADSALDRYAAALSAFNLLGKIVLARDGLPKDASLAVHAFPACRPSVLTAMAFGQLERVFRS